MTRSELLCALDILNAVSFIRGNLKDYLGIEGALEGVKTIAERIRDNIRQLDFLQQVEAVLRIFFNETIEEFESILSTLHFT